MIRLTLPAKPGSTIKRFYVRASCVTLVTEEQDAEGATVTVVVGPHVYVYQTDMRAGDVARLVEHDPDRV